MVLIEDYIAEKLETRTYQQLSDEVHISPPMISNYKKGHYNPSLKTAMSVLEVDGVTLHPFATDSLEYEIKKVK